METADDAAGVQVRRLAPPRRPNAFTVVVLRHHPQQPAAEDALLLLRVVERHLGSLRGTLDPAVFREE